MKRINGIGVLLVIVLIILLIGFSVFSTMPKDTNDTTVANSSNYETQNDVIEQLNNVEKVEIREKIITMNKEYLIYVDNEEIATVSGKYVNVTGDVFTLKDKYGNTLASEKQIKRWGIRLNRLAEVRNEKGEAVSYIGEDVIKDLFSISKYKFHFYDKKKNEYAYTKEKVLSLLYEFEVYNIKDIQIYKVEKNFNILTDSYVITKKEDSDVAMYEVVFLTCIVDAIMDAE
ncbi:MAG: hypothetical protein J6A15_09575 [Clostridia bacterium]|nr:hypothetical protein [Clostridia bacterium]